ncbi:MAG: PspC domain-containing protein [Clostridium sp.]|nr:PspC domain-containing protein [Prevotella sp.]MCM1428734.1 PspC domain-containing protein [Clostridium sp.]MCM1475109.1 PspC domain-containing protein [Muribaculaceae bacterium]
MKRTYSINIAGEPFIIDDDAYAMLRDYLDALRHSFLNTPDGQQIVEDLESRIAEIFLEEEEAGSKIITIKKCEGVISRIGRPEEFAPEDNSNEHPEEGNSEQPPIPEEPTTSGRATPPPVTSAHVGLPAGELQKRLYRDPEDKVLGGVCSGLAHYFGIDPVWIRIIMILLLFLSSSTIFVVYLVLWIAIPAADTPVRRLQMYGKSTSIQNIGKMVNSMFTSTETATATNRQSTFMQILSILGKCFMILLTLVAAPLMIAAACVLIAGLCMLVLTPFEPAGMMNILDACEPDVNLFILALSAIGGAISVGIPSLAVIWCTGTMFFREWVIPRKWVMVMLITWIAGLATVGISFAFL